MSRRKAVWGWMLFDWANQPWYTLIVTYVFGPYFVSRVAADPVHGQAVWGYAIAAASVVVALTAPVLGAIADAAGPRKPWVLAFSALYVVGAAGLWGAAPGLAEGAERRGDAGRALDAACGASKCRPAPRARLPS